MPLFTQSSVSSVKSSLLGFATSDLHQRSQRLTKARDIHLQERFQRSSLLRARVPSSPTVPVVVHLRPRPPQFVREGGLGDRGVGADGFQRTAGGDRLGGGAGGLRRGLG